MAKDPAFLFYPGDYLRDTQTLSEKTQVSYDRIICEHMRNICISQKQLKFFTKRLNEDELEELMFVLTKTKGGYQIEWVAESIIKRKEYSKSRSDNRKGKGKKEDDISLSYDGHMENENESEIKVESKREKLFKPDFENFISACFKYLGKPYTQGNPETHGIESPIRKWLVTRDANTQLRNLNAYITVTPDKQFRAKTIEKLLEKLEGYNFCQDLKTYSPSTNGQQQKTQEQLDTEKEEERLIRVAYAKSIAANEKLIEEKESDGDFEKLKSDIGK